MTNKTTPIATPHPEISDVRPQGANPQVVSALIGTSITLGAVGLVQGYTESQESTAFGKTLEALSKGVIYATGVGFIIDKLGDN